MTPNQNPFSRKNDAIIANKKRIKKKNFKLKKIGSNLAHKKNLLFREKPQN
jgi:hypothetical protein